MPYKLTELTDYSLKQLQLTMEDFCHKAELKQSTAFLELEHFGIKGVNKADHKTIIWQLHGDDYIHFSLDEHSVQLGKLFYSFLDEVSEEIHRRYHEKHVKKLPEQNEKPHYDLANGTLYIQNYKIKIRKHQDNYRQHQLLGYIFIKNAKEIDREFDFTEFPFDDVRDKEKFREICRTAYTAINSKIAKETENRINDFIQFNSITYGYLEINPKYLPK